MKFQSLKSNSQIRFLLETLARTQEEVSSAAANSLLRYQTIFRFAVVIQLVLFFFYLSRSPWASLHPLTKLSWSSSGSGDAIFRQSRWTKFSRKPVHISVTKRANVLRSSLCCLAETHNEIVIPRFLHCSQFTSTISDSTKNVH